MEAEVAIEEAIVEAIIDVETMINKAIKAFEATLTLALEEPVTGLEE